MASDTANLQLVSRILLQWPPIRMVCKGLARQRFPQMKEGERSADDRGAQDNHIRHILHHQPGFAREVPRLMREIAGGTAHLLQFMRRDRSPHPLCPMIACHGSLLNATAT
jgi:hypothetical protein